MITNESVHRALKFFGVEARSIKKPPDAKLALVYILDDRYVLRSRWYMDNTESRFAAERELLRSVARFTGYQFPEYQASEKGEYLFVDGSSSWTLHRLIPGQPLGNWYELHVVPSHVDRQVIAALRKLHDSTVGRFSERLISRTLLLDLLRPVLTEARAFLTGYCLRRIQSCFRRVEQFSRTYPATKACFVHGDFHHGNTLVNEGTIVGFIDLDWCRAGNACEDLGYTLMMLLRDYKTWSTEFSWQRYHEVLDLYGFGNDTSILNDYIALYALFDCNVFKAATFENAMDFYEYQKSFLETLCRTIVKGES